MNAPSSYTEQYRETLLDPSNWIVLAQVLREAATPLGDELRELFSRWKDGNASERSFILHQKVHVFYMLWAYSLENLLKALIVAKELIDGSNMEKPRLPNVLKSHDLTKLANKAEVKHLAQEYGKILNKLTQCSTWYGRYPVPVHAASLEQDDAAATRSSIATGHLRDLERLYTALNSELRKVCN